MPAEAGQCHFAGWQSFSADGLDLLPIAAARPGLCCRIYPDGSGLPDPGEIRRASKQAAARRVPA
jgi:hypothetical protein